MLFYVAMFILACFPFPCQRRRVAAQKARFLGSAVARVRAPCQSTELPLVSSVLCSGCLVGALAGYMDGSGDFAVLLLESAATRCTMVLVENASSGCCSVCTDKACWEDRAARAFQSVAAVSSLKSSWPSTFTTTNDALFDT